MTYCDGCQARVYWATTSEGNRILLDVDPVVHGTRYVVSVEGDDAHEVARALRSDEPAPVGAVVTSCHFDTCRNPEARRRAAEERARARRRRPARSRS